MPRLKVAEPVQHGPRHWEGPAKGIAKAKKANNARVETGKKARTFLTPSKQALLLVGYYELPKSQKGSKARRKALEKLCKKFDVHLDYPREMLRKLKKDKELPTRDGVGGAPERITDEEQEVLIATLVAHAYDLTYRQLQTLTGIPASTIWRFVKETEGWKVVKKGTRPYLTEAHCIGRYFCVLGRVPPEGGLEHAH